MEPVIARRKTTPAAAPPAAKTRDLPVVPPTAAGIDLGAAEHRAAVAPGRGDQPVRRRAACTADLIRLAEWLATVGITAIAMEATGVYWIPLLELRESRGFEV